jgi:uncharacterized protein
MNMEAARRFFSGNILMDDWIPLRYEKDGETVEFGEMVVMRELGSAGNTYSVGLWRCNVLGRTFFSSDDGDETFVVLEGEVEIEDLTDGTKHVYGPGDICSWSKGTPTMWDIRKPMKKVFVIADSGPPG